MRDAKLEEIEEGTSDIQRLIISRGAAGLSVGPRPRGGAQGGDAGARRARSGALPVAIASATARPAIQPSRLPWPE
jgi:hypothetical protein